MSIQITSLNSGSNGNCYYIANAHTAVLIDIGISCRETEKRMARLGLKIEKVKAIFISHEHSDHINGVAVFSRKYQIPVYITPSTLKNSRLFIEENLIRHFKAYQVETVGELGITAFPKMHDAIDAHSFIIESRGITIGVFTDIGLPCNHVIQNFKKCHAVFLEANYDEKMLDEGNYPYHLKKRISGSHGHLSNSQALDLFLNHQHPQLSHVFLAHLSKDNNCPDLVQKLFSKHAGKTQVAVASRYKELPVNTVNSLVANMHQKQKIETVQMSLF